MVYLDLITRSIAEKGCKVTHQQIVIYKELLGTNLHPTAEQVHNAIKVENPAISLATVYKTLGIFVEKKLINRVSSPRVTIRYVARIDNHNYIYVSNSDEIMDYDDEELKQMLLAYLDEKKINNLNITDFKLQIRGEKPDAKKGVSVT